LEEYGDEGDRSGSSSELIGSGLKSVIDRETYAPSYH
jgi:hypothetical protein